MEKRKILPGLDEMECGYGIFDLWIFFNMGQKT